MTESVPAQKNALPYVASMTRWALKKTVFAGVIASAIGVCDAAHDNAAANMILNRALGPSFTGILATIGETKANMTDWATGKATEIYLDNH